jgi:N-acetylglucosamine kinase-like BadF-type ATPase
LCNSLSNILQKADSSFVKYWRESYTKGIIFKRFRDNGISFEDMLELVIKSKYSSTGPTITEVADAAKLVFKAAEHGEKESDKILQESTEYSALYVSLIAEKIGLSKKHFKVAHMGSVMRNPISMSKFKRILKELEPDAELVKPLLDPLPAAIYICTHNIRFY